MSIFNRDFHGTDSFNVTGSLSVAKGDKCLLSFVFTKIDKELFGVTHVPICPTVDNEFVNRVSCGAMTKWSCNGCGGKMMTGSTANGRVIDGRAGIVCLIKVKDTMGWRWLL